MANAMPAPDPQRGPRRVYVNPIDVAKRLDELGLREGILIRGAMGGLQYWLDATALSCRSALGMIIWNFATQALRELLITEGWAKDNRLNYEITVSPTKTHAVAVSSANRHTGDPEHTPCTTTKGEQTRLAISRNLQLSFARYSPKDFPSDSDGGDEAPETWLLLYHIDKKKEEIRLELSLPDGFNSDNEINSFSERIILTAQPFDVTLSTALTDDDDNDDDIDFDIERK